MKRNSFSLMRHTEKNLKIVLVGEDPLLDHLLVNSLTLPRGGGLNLPCHIMGKNRHLSESFRSSSSSRTSISTTSSLSSSSSSSSSVSSLSSASHHSFTLQRFCKTQVLSEAEEVLIEIGNTSVRLNSYLEETRCEEPFLSDGEDERRVNVESGEKGKREKSRQKRKKEKK